jgi:hypothetical protein
LRDLFQLIYRASNAPPGTIFESGIALSIESKGRIVSAFDKPVSALIAVFAPGLHRQRLIQIVVLSALFV